MRLVARLTLILVDYWNHRCGEEIQCEFREGEGASSNHKGTRAWDPSIGKCRGERAEDRAEGSRLQPRCRSSWSSQGLRLVVKTKYQVMSNS